MKVAAGIKNPDEWFDISKAMAVAGLVHIIHKAVQGLERDLQHYKYLADIVEQLSSFFSFASSRHRLVETNFDNRGAVGSRNEPTLAEIQVESLPREIGFSDESSSGDH